MKNWKQRIKDAFKKGIFNETDIKDAGKWKTCAVGECVGGNPFEYGHKFYRESSEDKMEMLGYDFDVAVGSNDISTAQKIYNKIHRIKLKVQK